MIERLNPAHTLIARGEANGDLSVRPVLSESTSWRIQHAHSGAILALDWAPSGRHLASGGQDGIVRVWDTHTGISKNACAYPSAIRLLQWSPDGTSIALASSSQSLHVWHVFAVASAS